jgi:hypothetical protein
VAAYESKFPYLLVHYKQGFLFYKESKRHLDLKDFSFYFLSFLLQDFLTSKGDCGILLKGKNLATLLLIF